MKTHSPRLRLSVGLWATRFGWHVALWGVLVWLDGAPVVAGDLIGSKASWPPSGAWIEIPSLRDGSDSSGWDFTTNSLGQGTVYWADDSSYLYFRTRLHQSTITWDSSTVGTLWLYIRKPGSTNAIAWDAANYSSRAQHGLEMQVFSSCTGGLWPALTMDDIDTKPNLKESSDINATGYTTDGYLRVVDGLTGDDAGTCYLDWAISWNYLGNTTRHPSFSLLRTETFYLAVGSRNTGNDHSAFGSYSTSDLCGTNDFSSTSFTDPDSWGGPMDPTRVVLYDIQAGVRNSTVVICWRTASEVDSAGFRLYREVGSGVWTQVGGFVPAKGYLAGGIGATYDLEDPGAVPGQTYVYMLVEEETQGGIQEYGPFKLLVQELRLGQPVLVGKDGITLRWLSRSGEIYRIQRATCVNGPFTPLASGIPATPPENSFTGPMDQAQSFYKIEVER